MPAKSVADVLSVFFNRDGRYDCSSSHKGLYIERNILYSTDWQNPIAVDIMSSRDEFYLVSGDDDYNSGVVARHAQLAQDAARDMRVHHVVIPARFTGFGSVYLTDGEMLTIAMDALQEHSRSTQEQYVHSLNEAHKLQGEIAATTSNVELLCNKFKLPPPTRAGVWSVARENKKNVRTRIRDAS